MEPKKDLTQILQGYLGMTPKDKGADNYFEMQGMAEEEINNLINEEKRELTEQVKALRAALRWAYEEIKVLDKQIPLKNSYNLATENGRLAWAKHLDGMIEIEKTLATTKPKQ